MIEVLHMFIFTQIDSVIVLLAWVEWMPSVPPEVLRCSNLNVAFYY